MLSPLSPRPDGSLQASRRYAIVASRYNSEFVNPMMDKAVEEIVLVEPKSTVEFIHAPGAFEIPYLAGRVIERTKPDALICLGVILQGETGHADLIAAAVTECLCRMSVEKGIPVIHAVLLLRNEEQARERCLGNRTNRGTEAARAAIQALNSSDSINIP